MNNKQLDRFLAKVSVAPNGCWEWVSGRTPSGYGVFVMSWSPRRERTAAHRYSYEHFIGPIAHGLDIDHLCRNRRCVNPTHLEPVTRRDNVRRGMRCKESPHWQEYSLELREAIAASRRGVKRKPFSDEWRAKLGEANRRRKHSAETRAKMSASAKARRQRERQEKAA